MEFATDINNVMYAYIDRKKKFPVTTLLRSIGYETDKDILELFGMADEVKGDKKSLQKYEGRRLAAQADRADDYLLPTLPEILPGRGPHGRPQGIVERLNSIA